MQVIQSHCILCHYLIIGCSDCKAPGIAFLIGKVSGPRQSTYNISLPPTHQRLHQLFNMNIVNIASFVLLLTSTPVDATNNLRQKENHRLAITTNYGVAFAQIKDKMVWPTPNSTVHNISSTFGPRIRSSCNCYDFHRGVDIHGEIGDDVYASYGGVVKKVTTWGGGGKTIILEHQFPSSVDFNGASISRWYSLYLHLSEQLVSDRQVVEAGDLIGKVGDTGSTVTPHLHQEVRVGTRCSLEYALSNPSSTCNTLGIDPHVSPLFVYPGSVIGDTSISLTLQQNVSNNQDGQVHIETPDDAPNVNRYTIQLRDNSTSNVTLEHTLELNYRIGFDASSTAALDTQDPSIFESPPIWVHS